LSIFEFLGKKVCTPQSWHKPTREFLKPLSETLAKKTKNKKKTEITEKLLMHS